MFKGLNNLQRWQKERLFWILGFVLIFGIGFLIYGVVLLQRDKVGQQERWETRAVMDEATAALIAERSQNARRVKVGTYTEDLRSISMKDSSFEVVSLIWFLYDGEDLDMAHHFRIYKGDINDFALVKSIHENGTNYEQVRIDVTVSKNFNTRRFPLGSHQLAYYIESDYPVDTAHIIFPLVVHNSSL